MSKVQNSKRNFIKTILKTSALAAVLVGASESAFAEEKIITGDVASNAGANFSTTHMIADNDVVTYDTLKSWTWNMNAANTIASINTGTGVGFAPGAVTLGANMTIGNIIGDYILDFQYSGDYALILNGTEYSGLGVIDANNHAAVINITSANADLSTGTVQSTGAVAGTLNINAAGVKLLKFNDAGPIEDLKILGGDATTSSSVYATTTTITGTGILNVADGHNIHGAVHASGGGHGDLIFAGTSTLTGTAGTVGAHLNSVQGSANGGALTLQSDVYADSILFANSGANITGVVNAKTGITTGIGGVSFGNTVTVAGNGINVGAGGVTFVNAVGASIAFTDIASAITLNNALAHITGDITNTYAPGGTQTTAGTINVNASGASIVGNIGTVVANENISAINFQGDHVLSIDHNNAELYVQNVKTAIDGQGTLLVTQNATLTGDIGEDGTKAIKAITVEDNQTFTLFGNVYKGKADTTTVTLNNRGNIDTVS